MRTSTGCTCLLATLLAGTLAAEEPKPPASSAERLTAEELANWIDREFEKSCREANVTSPGLVDDATFLKRVHLDLTGSIPSVSRARDFLNSSSPTRRQELVERLLTDRRRPEKPAERTAAHLANVWRRMLVPGNTPEAQSAAALEPWLKEQFLANVPYDELARRLVTATNDGAAVMAPNPGLGISASGPGVYFQAIGGRPETAASSVSRVFLGVRLGCAECHDHPFASWKKKDFWGMAAFFAGFRNGNLGDVSTAVIRPETSTEEFAAAFLGGTPAEIERGKTPRETLVDWMVAEENLPFSATAVNRVWQHLLGHGLTDSVDDLDAAPPEQRRLLDDLARLFAQSGFDLRWLISGICRSRLYQRECLPAEEAMAEPVPGLRVVKTLSPEQIFNSLEQALALPVARADDGARFNGLRDQLIARFNEAAANNPDEFRAGIPQALLMMNGRLTADATDLDHSRTLRGVLEAPFLDEDAKLTTLYLAAFCRPPRPEERAYLMTQVREQSAADDRMQTYAEIFWSLLNSPEFVLER
jgi:hypothetical protein